MCIQELLIMLMLYIFLYIHYIHGCVTFHVSSMYDRHHGKTLQEKTSSFSPSTYQLLIALVRVVGLHVKVLFHARNWSGLSCCVIVYAVITSVSTYMQLPFFVCVKKTLYLLAVSVSLSFCYPFHNDLCALGGDL